MLLRLRNHSAAGFTLVEVAVAIAILAVAFTTLITLNTRFLSSYFNDRNITQAALLAQRVLSLMEVEGSPPDVGSKKGDFLELLEKSGDIYKKNEIEQLVKNWTYTLEVQAIPVPPDDDAMRRIDLTVSWGESAAEEFALVYFMKSKSET